MAQRDHPAVIRVVALDDHPAVLAGLLRLLKGSDGLSVIAAVDTAEALFGTVASARADVVIVDYNLARSDGLAVCQRLKEHASAPGVVVYSAYAGPALALGARIAGADAIVDKRAPASQLLEAVRIVADGRSMIPEILPEARQALLERLDPDDVPVVGMLLAGTAHHSIADALGTERREIVHRVRRVLARLGPKATLAGTSSPRSGPDPPALDVATHVHRQQGTRGGE